MGLSRKAKKKKDSRDHGEESLEGYFDSFSKVFGLVRLSLALWGPIHQEKFDEDLVFCFYRLVQGLCMASSGATLCGP